MTSDTDGRKIARIWTRYHRGRSPRLRNVLIEHYVDFVRYQALRVRSKLPALVDMDDLVQSGIFGLMNCIDAFDPSRGIKFETFSGQRIRGSMVDELRTLDWVPRTIRTLERQVRQGQTSLESRLGRPPTDAELAGELRVPVRSLAKMVRQAQVTAQFPLPDSRRGDNDDRSAGPIVDNRCEDPARQTQRKQLKELISRGLSRPEQLVITLYYFEELTMKEIGAVLDLSESRVSQMHTSIRQRLRAQLNPRELAG